MLGDCNGTSDPEDDTANQPDRADADNPREGELTSITCPECGGTLWQHEDSGFVRFKCHVGHAYSPGSLEVGHSQALEMALWAALRTLQERADLYRRLARRSEQPKRHAAKASEADAHAETLRSVVMSIGHDGTAAGETGTASA